MPRSPREKSAEADEQPERENREHRRAPDGPGETRSRHRRSGCRDTSRRRGCDRRKRIAKFRGSGVPIGGDARESPEGDVLQGLAHTGAHRAQRPRGFREHARNHALGVRPGERRLAGKHLVQHAAKRVDVGPGVGQALARRLFRTHVSGRADGHPRLREAASATLDGARDAEIGDHGVPAAEQDVLGLDVAMDHALPMRIVESVGYLAGDAHGISNRQLALALQLVPE